MKSYYLTLEEIIDGTTVRGSTVSLTELWVNNADPLLTSALTLLRELPPVVIDEVSFPPRPCIVCLCGSTKFKDAFLEAAERETLAGKIVLSVGCFAHADAKWAQVPPEAKAKLDTLHLHKIDLADEVLVLNVGGYVGASTKREIWYALLRGKRLRWLEPMTAPPHESSPGDSDPPIIDGPDLIELIYSWFDDWDHWARAGYEAAMR